MVKMKPVTPVDLVSVGETVSRKERLSRQEIIDFARLSGDANPLHGDEISSARVRFGEIIASGQHTGALLMGLLATHFSRDDGVIKREMLCLNVNLAFKRPVFAEQDITLRWHVSSFERNDKLGGLVVQLDGGAGVGARPAVVARATILVKEAAP
jgi:acyl dehydratase